MEAEKAVSGTALVAAILCALALPAHAQQTVTTAAVTGSSNMPIITWMPQGQATHVQCLDNRIIYLSGGAAWPKEDPCAGAPPQTPMWQQTESSKP